MKNPIALVGGKLETEKGLVRDFSILIENGFSCSVFKTEVLPLTPETTVYDISGCRVSVPAVDFSFLATTENLEADDTHTLDNGGDTASLMGWSFMRFNLHPTDTLSVKNGYGQVMLTVTRDKITFSDGLG